MPNLVVADFRVTGDEHLMFNGAVVEALSGKVGSRWNRVMFIASRSHVRAVKEVFQPDSVECIGLGETYSTSRIVTFALRELGFFYRFAFAWYNVWRSQAMLLVLTVSPISLLLLKCIVALLRSGKRCVVVHHADLELLRGDRDVTISSVCAWIAAKVHVPGMQHVVLSHHIKEQLALLQPLMAERTIAVTHPFPRRFLRGLRRDGGAASAVGGTVVIGIPGVVSRELKGSALIFDIERRLSDAMVIDRAELVLIGRASGHFMLPAGTVVRAPFLHRQTPVPQAEFEAELSRLHVIVLPYPETTYRLTASGAVFDALKYESPIFALRNPLFEDMEKRGMFPGRIFDAADDLIDAVLEVVSTNSPLRDSALREERLNALREASDPEHFLNLIFGKSAND